MGRGSVVFFLVLLVLLESVLEVVLLHNENEELREGGDEESQPEYADLSNEELGSARLLVGTVLSVVAETLGVHIDVGNYSEDGVGRGIVPYLHEIGSHDHGDAEQDNSHPLNQVEGKYELQGIVVYITVSYVSIFPFGFARDPSFMV